MNKKKAIILVNTLGAVIFICIILLSKRNDEFFKVDDKIFYSSQINGRIETIYANIGAVHVTLGSKEFVFVPISCVDNESKIFSSFAKIGDSLYKQSYSDTLTLFKHGKVYYYHCIKLVPDFK